MKSQNAPIGSLAVVGDLGQQPTQEHMRTVKGFHTDTLHTVHSRMYTHVTYTHVTYTHTTHAHTHTHTHTHTTHTTHTTHAHTQHTHTHAHTRTHTTAHTTPHTHTHTHTQHTHTQHTHTTHSMCVRDKDRTRQSSVHRRGEALLDLRRQRSRQTLGESCHCLTHTLLHTHTRYKPHQQHQPCALPFIPHPTSTQHNPALVHARPYSSPSKDPEHHCPAAQARTHLSLRVLHSLLLCKSVRRSVADQSRTAWPITSWSPLSTARYSEGTRT